MVGVQGGRPHQDAGRARRGPDAGRQPPRAAWLLLGSLLTLAPAPALAGDASLVWLTLHSEHLRVHCPEPLLPLGQRVVQAGEEAWAQLVTRFGWEPAAPLELRLEDQTDFANGLASSLPYNRVVVYGVPPESSSALHAHDDWLRLLVYHELTHIVHLDQATGLPALLNRVLGRTFLPNLVLPRWWHEGVAIWQESNLTGGGRLRSSLYKGQLRVAALAGTLPPADWMSSQPTAWPQGAAWYLFGSSFVAFLIEHHGEEAIARFTRLYGRSLVPYALNRTALQSFGATLEAEWARWQDALRNLAAAEARALRAAGLVEGLPLTAGGEEHAAPRFSPRAGGGLLYFASDGHRPAAFRLHDRRHVGEGRDLLQLDGAAAGSWDPGGESFVFHQPVIVGGLGVYHDLFRHELSTGATRRLTTGLRAREPCVGADGRIVFTRAAAGGTQLALADRDGRNVRPLPTAGVDIVSTPSLAPDGGRVAFSGWRAATGERDLYLLELGPTAALHRLTRDPAIDLDPTWSPDGRALFFASDREGVFDIYRLGLDEGVVRRVTRVLGGAFQPAVSPDGGSLAYVHLGPHGYDLRWLTLPAPERLPAVASTLAGGRARPRRYALVEPSLVQAVTPYSPLPSLLPRAYSPAFGATGVGQSWGILVAGEDALGRHAYLAQLELDPTHWTPAFSLSWSYDRFYPLLGLWASRSLQTWPAGFFDGTTSRPYTEETLAGGARLTFPFPLLRASQGLTLGYGATRYRPVSSLGDVDPGGLAPRYPATGLLAELTLGWYLSDARRQVFSSSPEEGRLASFVLGLREPQLGSDYSSLLASGSFQQFVRLPRAWAGHAVLSLRVAGGLASGEPGARPSFSLGGPPALDVVLALIDETYVGNSGYLRGFRPGVLTGDRYLLGNGEVRLPVLRVDRGVGFLPVYLRRLLVVPFVDHGQAAWGRLEPRDGRTGLGAELRADTSLGYYLDATWRLGYAHGLGEGAEDVLYLLLSNAY